MTACGPGARHRIGPGRFPWSNGCGRETASRPSDLIVTRVRPSSGRRRPAWAVAISRPRMSTRHGRRAATCKPFTCSINPFTVANMRGRSHSPTWGGCPSTTGRASAPIRAIVASWRATRSTTTTRPATRALSRTPWTSSPGRFRRAGVFPVQRPRLRGAMLSCSGRCVGVGSGTPIASLKRGRTPTTIALSLRWTRASCGASFGASTATGTDGGNGDTSLNGSGNRRRSDDVPVRCGWLVFLTGIASSSHVWTRESLSGLWRGRSVCLWELCRRLALVVFSEPIQLDRVSLVCEALAERQAEE